MVSIRFPAEALAHLFSAADPAMTEEEEEEEEAG